MRQRVFYNDPRRGHAVSRVPAYDSANKEELFGGGTTDEELLEWVIQNKVPRDADGNLVEHIVLPEFGNGDRGDVDSQLAKPRKLFRNSWVVRDGQLVTDMTMARQEHMSAIRKVRDEALEKESGSKDRQPPEIEATFTAERQTLLQTLRDIPQTFDLPTFKTSKTLDAAWPIELPARE